MSEESQGAGDRAMEIAALQQIGNTLGLINSQVLDQQKLLMDVRDRVIAIESNRLEGEVHALNERVTRMGDKLTVLEHAEIRRSSQIGVWGWISEKLPWLVAIVLSAAAVVGFDRFVEK